MNRFEGLKMICKTAFTMIAVALLIFSSHDSVARDIGISRASIKRFHIKEILADSNTMPLSKSIYLDKGNPFATSRVDSFLTMIDSFPRMDSYHKGFYFIAVTRSSQYADGAYSEGLCAASLDYVQMHESEFLDFFIGIGKLPESHLEIWTNNCVAELRLESDNDSTEANKLIDSLWKPKLTPAQTDVLLSFTAMLAAYTAIKPMPYMIHKKRRDIPAK